MSTRRPITASTVMLVVGNVFPPAATFVMAPFLAHSLGVDGRGELAAVTAPFLLALSIGTFGIPDAVTQTIASGRRVARSGWWLAWLLLAVGGIAALAAVTVAAPLIVGTDAADLTALVTVATAATAPALFVALLRGRAAGRHAWGFVTAERVTAASVKIVGTLVLAGFDRLDLPSAVAIIAFSPVVGGVVYLFMPRATPPADAAAVVHARSMLGFSLRSWLGSAAGVLLVRLDQLLVLPLASAEQLGLYAVAVNVAEVPVIVTNAIREVMLSNDAADADDVRVPRVARSAAVLAVAIALPLGCSAPFWVPFVFGEAFAAAVPVMAISIVAVVIGVPGSIAGSTLTARGRPELRSMSITIGCVANVVALVVLVPVLGAVGAATAALVGNLLSSNGSVRWAARLTGARMRDFYAVRPADARRVGALAVRLVRPVLARG
ncbi:lipopolysaccharide biosynthesis protein [Curtobacterium aurantiacum]|uniref:lipopolysaccharide biosynthesis protein n=1 Tax=Curtobacterium aurantiacum TaxID=3236919 RepID=UPI001BDF94A5|nr:oligosaccharide flippase family protein [Curtobacterium flaccumfaciens]MBT1675096.1 oligosaccharide flippase family protein [Curtobacterium flaccumfaciens pv. flaccumfaciens]